MAVHAQYAGYTLLSDVTGFKGAFAAASAKMTSLSCDFVQEKNLSMLSEKIVSRGKFRFRKDNKVRMEYTQPFQYLMIMAGDRIYIRDDQKEHSVSTKSNKLFGQINELVVDCVKGSALENPHFSVRVFEGAGNYLIELTPTGKDLKELFKTINISIDKKDFSASGIDMREPSGDYTILTFTHKELNSPLPDALFTMH